MLIDRLIYKADWQGYGFPSRIWHKAGHVVVDTYAATGFIEINNKNMKPQPIIT